jgi:hypothetical protein
MVETLTMDNHLDVGKGEVFHLGLVGVNREEKVGDGPGVPTT